MTIDLGLVDLTQHLRLRYEKSVDGAGPKGEPSYCEKMTVR
jgi:hypothetical protein